MTTQTTTERLVLALQRCLISLEPYRNDPNGKFVRNDVIQEANKAIARYHRENPL